MAKVTTQELLQRTERLENEINSLRSVLEKEYGIDFDIQREKEEKEDE